MASAPRASRPHMPDYGLAPEGEGDGLLPFSWAIERLERSRNYWLSTVRSDGRPHAMAVWAVWLDGAFYFSTAEGSRKARNLAHSPYCVITTERADEAVVVEGLAERASHVASLAHVQARYQAKYGSAYPLDSGVFSVRPSTVFAFIEREELFLKTATRWRFVSA